MLSICTNWKIVGSNFFGKLKIDGNLVVKSKVPPRSGSVALRMLNAVHRKGPSSCFKKKNKKNTWNKAYSEEWIWTRRYLYIIYLHSNKFLQTTLENYMYIMYAPVHLEVTGICHGTLLPLTLKTSLNTDLVNIFNWTLNVGSLSFVIN